MTFSPESQAKNKLRKVPEHELRNPKWKQIRVTLDWEDGFYVTCWTTGDRWNGWVCPSFEFKEAERLCRRLNEDSKDYEGLSTVKYDKAKDAFIITDPNYDDPEERFTEHKGEVFDVNGKKLKLYDIGSHCWTWSEAPEEEPEDVGDQED